MSAKVHLHLHVSDLAKSREFYRRFFGDAPVKEKPGYVKFLPAWAPVNLALSEGTTGSAGGLLPELPRGRGAAEERVAADHGGDVLRADVELAAASPRGAAARRRRWRAACPRRRAAR